MKAQITPYAYSDAPHEGPNNPLHPFGRPDGNHRLDLLLLLFLLSREEKEVRVWGAKPPRKLQRTSYAYQTYPMKAQTTLCAHSAAPAEGSNNPLRLFGRLDGNHRLDLLLLPFLLSREEKEVGAWGRSHRESPNEPPTSTQRTP